MGQDINNYPRLLGMKLIQLWKIGKKENAIKISFS